MIKIGGIDFRTKSLAMEYVGGIRRSYEGRDRGAVTDPHHLAVLRDLVQFSPKRELYEEYGIEGFDTWTVVPYGGVGFRILLSNGVRDPFSYKKCFEQPTKKAHVLVALRSAIKDQVLAFKAQCLRFQPVVCEISGETLTAETFHADHAPPWTFKAIAAAFLSNEELERVEVTDGQCGVGRVLVDKDLERRWSEFHRSKVHWRALHARENLRAT